MHEKAVQPGKYNFEGCRIPENEKLNIQNIREMLHDYKDHQLCDFLEFGIPIGYTGNNEILNQRTNGPVNAHLISWPSKAQNKQNLENVW